MLLTDAFALYVLPNEVNAINITVACRVVLRELTATAALVEDDRTRPRKGLSVITLIPGVFPQGCPQVLHRQSLC